MERRFFTFTVSLFFGVALMSCTTTPPLATGTGAFVWAGGDGSPFPALETLACKKKASSHTFIFGAGCEPKSFPSKDYSKCQYRWDPEKGQHLRDLVTNELLIDEATCPFIIDSATGNPVQEPNLKTIFYHSARGMAKYARCNQEQGKTTEVMMGDPVQHTELAKMLSKELKLKPSELREFNTKNQLALFERIKAGVCEPDITKRAYKPGEQILLIADTHGIRNNQMARTFRVESLQTQEACTTDGTFSYDQLKEIRDCANQNGNPVAIVGLSCFSGALQELRNDQTCVISAANFRDVGTTGFSGQFSYFLNTAENLEQAFLEARLNDPEPTTPEISSQKGNSALKALATLHQMSANQEDDLDIAIGSVFAKTACGDLPALGEIERQLRELEKVAVETGIASDEQMRKLREHVKEYSRTYKFVYERRNGLSKEPEILDKGILIGKSAWRIYDFTTFNEELARKTLSNNIKTMQWQLDHINMAPDIKAGVLKEKVAFEDELNNLNGAVGFQNFLKSIIVDDRNLDKENLFQKIKAKLKTMELNPETRVRFGSKGPVSGESTIPNVHAPSDSEIREFVEAATLNIGFDLMLGRLLSMSRTAGALERKLFDRLYRESVPDNACRRFKL